MQNGISAIICTYNRLKYLNLALESLVRQTLSSQQHEIIVVDNGVSKEVQELLSSHYPQVRYIPEPILGISQARNTGWKRSQFNYVAYMDDDAIAKDNWLEQILLRFQSVGNNVACIAGKITPIWPEHPPAWLPSILYPHLTIIDWSRVPKPLSEQEWFAGANMAIRKDILEKIGGFCTKLGRKGNQLLSLEENFFRLTVEKLGHICYYDPSIEVRHHIHPERLSKHWFEKRCFWGGVSNAIMQIEQKKISKWKRFTKGSYLLLRHLLSPYYNWILWSSNDDPNVFQQHCACLGIIGYALQLLNFFEREKHGQ